MSGLEFCRVVHAKLMSRHYQKYAEPFYFPVDAVALELPDYYEIIKNPMDLDTIKKKLDEGKYKNATEFDADIQLMFNNCYLYNPSTDPVIKCADKLKEIYLKEFAKFESISKEYDHTKAEFKFDKLSKQMTSPESMRTQMIRLRNEVCQLQTTELTMVVDILKDREPELVPRDADSIDLSFDQIKNSTFQALQEFVQNVKERKLDED